MKGKEFCAQDAIELRILWIDVWVSHNVEVKNPTHRMTRSEYENKKSIHKKLSNSLKDMGSAKNTPNRQQANGSILEQRQPKSWAQETQKLGKHYERNKGPNVERKMCDTYAQPPSNK